MIGTGRVDQGDVKPHVTAEVHSERDHVADLLHGLGGASLRQTLRDGLRAGSEHQDASAARPLQRAHRLFHVTPDRSADDHELTAAHLVRHASHDLELGGPDGREASCEDEPLECTRSEKGTVASRDGHSLRDIKQGLRLGPVPRYLLTECHVASFRG